MENISIFEPNENRILESEIDSNIDFTIHRKSAYKINNINNSIITAIPLGKVINTLYNKIENELYKNKKYIVNLTKKNIYLLLEVHEIALLSCSLYVFGKLENGEFINLLDDSYYLSYKYKHHYNEIEYSQWGKYEKIDIYNFTKL